MTDFGKIIIIFIFQEICYTLLINEQYNEVDKIFSSPVLKNFWLPLLFKLLKDCPNVQVFPIAETSPKSTSICAALRFLLRKTHTTSWNDPTLKRLKQTLESHLDVLEWILKTKQYAALPNASTSGLTYPNFTIKQAFDLFQSHSTLAVLKMTTNIHEKNYEDIVVLLRNRDDTRSTFRAYRAMLSALKAIMMCDSYSSKYQEVARHFDDMEKLLGSLFPLDLRLEVIENIFSMLFIRHEDFVEMDSSSDGGEEEYTEKCKDVGLSGFLCDKYAAREIIHRLKRSVRAAEIEGAERKRTQPVDVTESVERSILFVSKALADASWRLELLTSSNFVERQGTPDSDSQETNVIDDRTIFGDGRLSYSSSSKNKTIFYKPNESSSDESEVMRSDFDGSSEAGSQGNAASNGGRRRKRSRIHSSAVDTPTTIRDFRRSERTLNCMLASKESLVLQCLWKGDYDRALQVIEVN